MNIKKIKIKKKKKNNLSGKKKKECSCHLKIKTDGEYSFDRLRQFSKESNV
jgi:hypothetical protein